MHDGQVQACPCQPQDLAVYSTDIPSCDSQGCEKCGLDCQGQPQSICPASVAAAAPLAAASHTAPPYQRDCVQTTPAWCLDHVPAVRDSSLWLSGTLPQLPELLMQGNHASTAMRAGSQLHADSA